MENGENDPNIWHMTSGKNQTFHTPDTGEETERGHANDPVARLLRELLGT